jgi:hypothetical protein
MKVNYTYSLFEDLIEPNGCLGIDKRFHACWSYTTKAMRAREKYSGGTENQIIQYRVGTPIAQMPTWHESRDEEIARSTALIYGLESPDDFLKTIFTSACARQAAALGLRVDHEIYRVRPGAWKLQ